MKSVLCFIVLLALLAGTVSAQIPAVNDSAASQAAVPVVNVPAQIAAAPTPVTSIVAVKTVSLSDSVKIACDSLSLRQLAEFSGEHAFTSAMREALVKRFMKDMNAMPADSIVGALYTIDELATEEMAEAVLAKTMATQLVLMKQYRRELSLRDARIETLTQALVTILNSGDSTLTASAVLKNPRDMRAKVLGAAAHQVVHAENLTKLTMASSEAIGEIDGAVNNLAGVVQEGFATERARTNELTLVTDELSRLVEGHFTDRRGILRRHHDGNSLAEVQDLRERLIASAR